MRERCQKFADLPLPAAAAACAAAWGTHPAGHDGLLDIRWRVSMDSNVAGAVFSTDGCACRAPDFTQDNDRLIEAGTAGIATGSIASDPESQKVTQQPNMTLSHETGSPPKISV